MYAYKREASISTTGEATDSPSRAVLIFVLLDKIVRRTDNKNNNNNDDDGNYGNDSNRNTKLKTFISTSTCPSQHILSGSYARSYFQSTMSTTTVAEIVITTMTRVTTIIMARLIVK